ncbi:hypothetical protein TEQG_01105 [Trichophyton equinum CBS 127.97]|uniref:Uncharacterized protein n=1 Tax=Trichophyton equinum (strain ATCC MYA-4606 / CBS 127.97) TaxID=559882 RepID=F2PJJ8_TRIEC|nr:hypothetical protein TEQG_01105 [Trichophyton equinum CBS 127.97]
MSIQHPQHTMNQAACLTMLPNELILLISDHLMRKQDLNSFLRCNRRFYSLLNKRLYQLAARSRNNDAMMWALKTANVELAKRAIDAGSDPEKEFKSGGWRNDRPLHVAVRHASETKKRSLLPEGEMQDFLQKNDNLIRYLVSLNTDVNRLDNFTQSPLWEAVIRGEINSVRLFLDNGGDTEEYQDFNLPPVGEERDAAIKVCREVSQETGITLNVYITLPIPGIYCIIETAEVCRGITILEKSGSINGKEVQSPVTFSQSGNNSSSASPKSILVKNY